MKIYPETNEETNSIKIAIDAIQILYNLSTIGAKSKSNGKVTLAKKIFRLKVIQWGGFVDLFYRSHNCKVKSIKDFCETLELKKIIKGKKLNAVINSVKFHLSKTVENSDNLLSYHDLMKIESARNTSLKLRSKGMILLKHEVIFPK